MEQVTIEESFVEFAKKIKIIFYNKGFAIRGITAL
jgi:hypothetical protein